MADVYTRVTGGSGRSRHAAKRDYPNEALCGVVLSPNTKVRNLRDRKRCNKCINIYTGGGR